MRDLERALDDLAPVPGELPPSVVTALRAVRTRLRIVRSSAALAAVLALAGAVWVMVTTPGRSGIPAPNLAASDSVELPTSPFALAVLSRNNRDVDPDRLVLPDFASGAAGPSPRAADARSYQP